MKKDFDRASLIRRALAQQKEAYAPYSGYQVSAAVLTGSGTVYTGVNVENASYPAGICAERNAVFHAVSCGERRLTAIAIVAGRDGANVNFPSPCGICRQVMREFCNPKEMTVLLAKSPEEYKEMTLEELLPESFGPEDLARG
ncbi:MAG: cytidine deaminase [Clostridia bacterium]|nr:cytidine deaminase [Clostridia bacterium]